jgi:SAM-dependent methyltransferase
MAIPSTPSRPGSVQVVFCMDTEGPCRDPGNSELLPDWPSVDRAMDRLFDPDFRARFPAPDGSHLQIGWFFLTWVGFTSNPRDRAFGYHAVRDHYLKRYASRLEQLGDEHCWHYHHPDVSRVGNVWGTDWVQQREYLEILSRQILERNFWPVSFRAGGTIETPESSRWIDRWFPFDHSNRSPFDYAPYVHWSKAPKDWVPYHPDTEEFTRSGDGRRWMFRCLDLVTNIHRLDRQDIEQAFREAASGKQAVLSCFDHDYRDIAPRIDEFRKIITEVAKSHPSVSWTYATPTQAAQRSLGIASTAPLRWDAQWIDKDSLEIWSNQEIFQPRPWVAIQAKDGRVLTPENSFLKGDRNSWKLTLPGLRALAERTAFAGCTTAGVPSIGHIRSDQEHTWDDPATFQKPFPQKEYDIWHHTHLYLDLCERRTRETVSTNDSANQAKRLIQDRSSGKVSSLLDVACGPGHAWIALHTLCQDYLGIDEQERAIRIGRKNLALQGLRSECLRVGSLDQLSRAETFDTVVALNYLSYEADFRKPLEILARACDRLLVIRAGFDEKSQTRYLPDVLLVEGHQHLRAYFQLIDKAEVSDFLTREGFSVEWISDERQQIKFKGDPEIVGGIPLRSEFLVATRVKPRPSLKDLLPDSIQLSHRSYPEGELDPKASK